MKNLSLILNGVLAVAVAILFYLHFSTHNNETVVVEETEEGNASASELAVAYVDADSLLSKYELFKDLRSQLEEKGKKLDSELKSRGEGLQKEISDFQRSIQNLTINQAKALEENLMKKQQNFRVYQENLSRELINEEAKMNKDINDRVYNYLEEYGKSNGLNLVVKFNRGSDIIYADSTMDITLEVIEGLNKEYAQENVAVETDSTTTK